MKHTIEVSFTPLCTACGKELQTGGTEYRATNHPFERDNAWERKDQRVFVYACTDCFVWKGDLDK